MALELSFHMATRIKALVCYSAVLAEEMQRRDMVEEKEQQLRSELMLLDRECDRLIKDLRALGMESPALAPEKEDMGKENGQDGQVPVAPDLPEGDVLERGDVVWADSPPTATGLANELDDVSLEHSTGPERER